MKNTKTWNRPRRIWRTQILQADFSCKLHQTKRFNVSVLKTNIFWQTIFFYKSWDEFTWVFALFVQKYANKNANKNLPMQMVLNWSATILFSLKLSLIWYGLFLFIHFEVLGLQMQKSSDFENGWNVCCNSLPKRVKLMAMHRKSFFGINKGSKKIPAIYPPLVDKRPTPLPLIHLSKINNLSHKGTRPRQSVPNSWS